MHKALIFIPIVIGIILIGLGIEGAFTIAFCSGAISGYSSCIGELWPDYLSVLVGIIALALSLFLVLKGVRSKTSLQPDLDTKKTEGMQPQS
jgi:hypothetical protein